MPQLVHLLLPYPDPAASSSRPLPQPPRHRPASDHRRGTIPTDAPPSRLLPTSPRCTAPPPPRSRHSPTSNSPADDRIHASRRAPAPPQRRSRPSPRSQHATATETFGHHAHHHRALPSSCHRASTLPPPCRRRGTGRSPTAPGSGRVPLASCLARAMQASPAAARSSNVIAAVRRIRHAVVGYSLLSLDRSPVHHLGQALLYLMCVHGARSQNMDIFGRGIKLAPAALFGSTRLLA